MERQRGKRNEFLAAKWQFAGESTERLSGGNDADFIHIEAKGYEAGGGICLVHNKAGGVGRQIAKLVIAAPELLAACEAASRALFVAAQVLDDSRKEQMIKAMSACESAIAKATQKNAD